MEALAIGAGSNEANASSIDCPKSSCGGVEEQPRPCCVNTGFLAEGESVSVKSRWGIWAASMGKTSAGAAACLEGESVVFERVDLRLVHQDVEHADVLLQDSGDQVVST